LHKFTNYGKLTQKRILEPKSRHIESLLENDKANNTKKNAGSFINCPVGRESGRLDIVGKGVPDVRPVKNAKTFDAGLSEAPTKMQLEGSDALSARRPWRRVVWRFLPTVYFLSNEWFDGLAEDPFLIECPGTRLAPGDRHDFDGSRK
jgi:hypothetical protein